MCRAVAVVTPRSKVEQNQHRLADIELVHLGWRRHGHNQFSRRAIAVCSCGWRSAPAVLRDATAGWRNHRASRLARHLEFVS